MLVAWIVVLGAVVPFWLSISALRHLAPTAAGLVATIEPVFASIVAWLWVEQVLTGWQVAGGVVVLTGIVLAQTARATPVPHGPAGDPRGARQLTPRRGVLLQVTFCDSVSQPASSSM